VRDSIGRAAVFFTENHAGRYGNTGGGE
jgi:hypothetical protein